MPRFSRDFLSGLRRLSALLALLLLAACGGEPDADAVRQAVQGDLDQTFGEGVIEITTFNRQGSGADTGSGDRVVYFTTEVTFQKPYDFSAWQGRNLAALADVLGATEKGLLGDRQASYQPGDTLRAYGSAVFVREGKEWRFVDRSSPSPTRAPTYDNVGPPSQDATLLSTVAAALKGQGDEIGRIDPGIAAHELDFAILQMRLQMDHRAGALTLASGPPGAVYERIGTGIERAYDDAGGELRSHRSAGSVANADLVQRGLADFGLVQNDVALLALRGDAAAGGMGPLPALRAVASLFPEPIHVIVPADSDIRRLDELAGRQVDIGPPRSGGHVSARALLSAAGIALGQLGGVQMLGIDQAAERFRAGTLDALLVTSAAPSGSVSALASATQVRFVSLSPELVRQAQAVSPYYLPYTIPPVTYPNQGEPVETIAATALVLAHAEGPEGRVRTFLERLFGGVSQIAGSSLVGSSISLEQATSGVSIPLHPEAYDFYKENGVPVGQLVELE